MSSLQAASVDSIDADADAAMSNLLTLSKQIAQSPVLQATTAAPAKRRFSFSRQTKTATVTAHGSTSSSVADADAVDPVTRLVRKLSFNKNKSGSAKSQLPSDGSTSVTTKQVTVGGLMRKLSFGKERKSITGSGAKEVGVASTGDAAPSTTEQVAAERVARFPALKASHPLAAGSFITRKLSFGRTRAGRADRAAGHDASSITIIGGTECEPGSAAAAGGEGADDGTTRAQDGDGKSPLRG